MGKAEDGKSNFTENLPLHAHGEWSRNMDMQQGRLVETSLLRSKS
jgi:hypothetical protein